MKLRSITLAASVAALFAAAPALAADYGTQSQGGSVSTTPQVPGQAQSDRDASAEAAGRYAKPESGSTGASGSASGGGDQSGSSASGSTGGQGSFSGGAQSGSTGASGSSAVGGAHGSSGASGTAGTSGSASGQGNAPLSDPMRGGPAHESLNKPQQ